ncbi:MAG TPA: MFS transporter [Myxococcaceae bacterium]|nr:MFS transporter [Myxococcaceae bacterium]
MLAPAVSAGSDVLTYTRDPRKRRALIASIITGTTIEWYDFYLYFTLFTVMQPVFFPGSDPVAGWLKALAANATGFLIRPVGAVFFGRLGDLRGRKSAFLVTLLLMGVATTAIGLLPAYAQVGVAAPILLVLMRLVQGFALGGEYGGAAIFVAENVPDGERGYYTSFVQTTASVGLFVAMVTILGVQRYLGPSEFDRWGWKLPFVFSFFLLAIAGWVRTNLGESPLWEQMKKDNRLAREPLVDAAQNWKKLVIALFGATAGQGVIWYTAQFYSTVFMTKSLGVPKETAWTVLSIALICGIPLFVVFGALSDRVGRKRLMVTGNLLAAISFVPIYVLMSKAAAPFNGVLMTALVFVQVVLVTMTYGPIAAFLVEWFPARSRYVSLSIPYHLGNGIFGGLIPVLATNLSFGANNRYVGLAWPCGVALMSALVGALFLPETSKVRIWAELRKRPGSGTGPYPTREPTGPLDRPPSGVHLVPPRS